MSGRRVTEALDDGSSAVRASLPGGSSLPVRPLAGALALVPLVGTVLYRVAHNAPGSPPAFLGDLAALALPFAAAGPALAALLLASVVEKPAARVGLAFAGGFGLLALAASSAWYPAAVGVAFGGALLAGSVGVRARRSGAVGLRHSVVAALLIVGVIASLAAVAGVASATLRPLGSDAALVGVGLAPVLLGTDRTSLLAGIAAAVCTLSVATGLPYVAGATLLVGGGVVGAPISLVVLAVGGGVAAVVSALRRGRLDGACGAGLLVAAGVPATLPRALGVVVALALLLGASGGDAS